MESYPKDYFELTRKECKHIIKKLEIDCINLNKYIKDMKLFLIKEQKKGTKYGK